MGNLIRIFFLIFVVVIAVGGYFVFIKSDTGPPATEADVTEVDRVVVAREEIQKEQVAVVADTYVQKAGDSPITGTDCTRQNERSLAIMYSGDVETRPYFSGIADAGFVVEMDHRFTHGGTRVIGIFECEKPAFVGPMRSGRVDFLSVAGAFDAIYVPWGGDSTSKGLLKKRVQDHIDCNSEVAPGGSSLSCFRRDVSIVPLGKEDRAFSSATELFSQAESIGYRTTNNFSGFLHQGDAAFSVRPAKGKLSVNLQNGFRVAYQYNRDNNTYERFFEGSPEYDLTSQRRVAPKNVIVIKSKKGTFSANVNYANSSLENPWDGVDAIHKRNDAGAYPNFALGDAWFDTVFSGEAMFYIDGQEIKGTWKKERSVNAPFEFVHHSGRQMKFVPGQIWMHVIDTNRSAVWQAG